MIPDRSSQMEKLINITGKGKYIIKSKRILSVGNNSNVFFTF